MFAAEPASPKPAPRAVIFGCRGVDLEDGEAAFFAEADPLGFILFQRNCRDPQQIRNLTAALRDCLGRPDAPILIDQEGGRVARLLPPHWRAAPPAGAFGALYGRSPEQASQAVYINHRLIAAELADLGINVNCAPVLDLGFPGAHDIIGDRAFAADPAVVARLGGEAIRGMMEGGVTPVIKHIPGHGRAKADSHKELPVVDAPADDLGPADFSPFVALADAPWAMTAHILYRAIDRQRSATLSPAVISEVIRDQIGFDGVLVTDDLSMSALQGAMASRVRQAMEAGCDLVLHCNGDMAEMREAAAAAPLLSGLAQERLMRARQSMAAVSRDQSRDSLLDQWRRMEPFFAEM